MELARTVEGLVVAVGADRYRAGLEVIAKMDPEVFVLDDGFQHRRLHRDLDLVCVDAAEPVAELRLLPAGRLRERLGDLDRAGALIWTGWTERAPSDELASRILGALESEKPVFRSVNTVTGFTSIAGKSETLTPDTFEGQPVAVLAAIAKPHRFIGVLEDHGAEVVWSDTRRDHHVWRPEEVDLAADKAKQSGAKAVLTTGKDAVKMAGLDRLALPLYRVDGRAEILEIEAFAELLDAVFRA
jgi:tetraacyldisaccharide 4'-kinase